MLESSLYENRPGATQGDRMVRDEQSRQMATSIWNCWQTHTILLLLALTGIFIGALQTIRRVVGGLMFAMDDAWIHVSMSRNLAEGLGFGIAPNHLLSLSTSPTWTLLVAAGYWLYPDPIKTTFALSFLCTGLASLLFYFLTKTLTGYSWLGLVGALLFVSNPLTIWGMGSGMEIPLALVGLMAVLTLYYSFDPETVVRRWIVPVALAFAAVTRPELFLLIPIAVADTFVALYRRGTKEARQAAFWTLFVQGVVLIATLSPYFAFNLISHGRIFPTTYYAKTLIRGVGLSAALASGDWSLIYKSVFLDPRREVLELAQVLLKFNMAVFLVMAAGLLAFCDRFCNKATARGWLMPVALVVCPYVMGMSTPIWQFSNYSNRYFAVFPPMAILMACLALGVLWRYGALRRFVPFCAALMLLYPFATTEGAFQRLAYGADSTNLLYVESSKWLKDNLPADAVVAVNDIGTFSYYLKREMIDVMGLASPEIWPAIFRPAGKKQDLNKLRDYLREKKVDYVILCPLYYPAITNDREVFEPIKQWAERYNHNRFISPQILYKVHWDKENRAA